MNVVLGTELVDPCSYERERVDEWSRHEVAHKKPLRFALAGTGFWSRYQLHGWRELPGCECVAVYNRTRTRAEALAREFGITSVYDDCEAMLAQERLDFVDIVTSVEQHAPMARLHACNPQVHAFDDRSLIETLAIQADTVIAARRFAGEKPAVISPITLTPRIALSSGAATGLTPPGTKAFPFRRTADDAVCRRMDAGKPCRHRGAGTSLTARSRSPQAPVTRSFYRMNSA